MFVVEYQFSTLELVLIGVWQDFKHPLSIFGLCLFSIAQSFLYISGAKSSFYALVVFYIFVSLIRVRAVYRQTTSDRTATLRIRLSVRETGILITTAETRVERTWHSLHSWSQTKNYFYLYPQKKGGLYTAIPKRAFTDEQAHEFVRQLKKINTHQPQRPLSRVEPFLGKKEKIMGQLFLSYAREDASSALRLFDDLRRAGMEVWLDKEYLLAGQNWKAAIKEAIRGSRFFVALLSNNSVSKKGYVQNELKHALEILDEYPETTIFIIPIRIDNCNPTSERLKELHWIDMFDDWDEGLVKILRTIRSQNDALAPSQIKLPPIRSAVE
jgi:TIR domain/YcxB-like protein